MAHALSSDAWTLGQQYIVDCYCRCPRMLGAMPSLEDANEFSNLVREILPLRRPDSILSNSNVQQLLDCGLSLFLAKQELAQAQLSLQRIYSHPVVKPIRRSTHLC